MIIRLNLYSVPIFKEEIDVGVEGNAYGVKSMN